MSYSEVLIVTINRLCRHANLRHRLLEGDHLRDGHGPTTGGDEDQDDFNKKWLIYWEFDGILMGMDWGK